MQEIRSYEQPTRIAIAPPFIKGVVNLRGVGVPTIDLRLKLGCASVECNSFTVVVVLNVHGRVVGAVVDCVSEGLELAGDKIKPAPQLQLSVDACFITGIGTVQGSRDEGERMLILMDIEGLMSAPRPAEPAVPRGDLSSPAKPVLLKSSADSGLIHA